MRIVGGVWAGTDLVSPGRRVRPTAEAVRERWIAAVEPYLDGARVLDLFSGSGALGLEALSRGAAHADFVESGAAALHALKANVAALRVPAPARGSKRGPTARVFKRDAIPFVEKLEEGAYDVAFVDPPYGSRKLDRVVAAWERVRFARILGVEHATDHPLPAGGRRFGFGETSVTLFGLKRDRRPGARRGTGKKGSRGPREGGRKSP